MRQTSSPAYDRDLLFRILSTPASPFRERCVQDLITTHCQKIKLPYFKDPVGNLVIGVSSLVAYKKFLATKSKTPTPVFIAHMDHPGFHVTGIARPTSATVGKNKNDPSILNFAWHGGSPKEFLMGAKVWLATETDGFVGHAEIIATDIVATPPTSGAGSKTAAPRPKKKKPAAPAWTGQIKLQGALTHYVSDPTELFGGFGFRAPVWQENELIYTKAADDLVGCFVTLQSVQRSFKKGKPQAIGLLTRAEEVGFIGAIGHLRKGWLQKAKRPILAVSLETSRQLPGAEIGKGPIVRLGDRRGVFHSAHTAALAERVAKLLPDQHQKRIMDGGTCEATAAILYGLPAIGLSVPLGNYHNQGFEGGPDCRGPQGPAPEFVHEGDVQKLLKICESLASDPLDGTALWKQKKAELDQLFLDYQNHLN